MAGYATLTPQQILQAMGMAQPATVGGQAAGATSPAPSGAGAAAPSGFFAQPMPMINPMTGQPMPTGSGVDPRMLMQQAGGVAGAGAGGLMMNPAVRALIAQRLGLGGLNGAAGAAPMAGAGGAPMVFDPTANGGQGGYVPAPGGTSGAAQSPATMTIDQKNAQDRASGRLPPEPYDSWNDYLSAQSPAYGAGAS